MAPRELTPQQRRRYDIVAAVLRPGDLVMYTVCMGRVREVRCTTIRSGCIHGEPTADTKRIEGWKGADWRGYVVDDISFLSVTHINRDPVDEIPGLAELGAREWVLRHPPPPPSPERRP